jgi:hypothetical protein
MGCKMCAFSCPFDKAILEAHSPSPRIRKCFFCWDKRLVKGEIPACVEACPTEALIFGTRRELLDEARTRIYQNPNRYIHHIYGESEVGGTSVLLLSSVPFERFAYRSDMGSQPLPQLTYHVLSRIPDLVTVGGVLLGGIWWITKRREEVVAAEGGPQKEKPGENR